MSIIRLKTGHTSHPCPVHALFSGIKAAKLSGASDPTESQGELIDVFKKVLYEEVKKKHMSIFPNYLQDGSTAEEWENLPLES